MWIRSACRVAWRKKCLGKCIICSIRYNLDGVWWGAWCISLCQYLWIGLIQRWKLKRHESNARSKRAQCISFRVLYKSVFISCVTLEKCELGQLSVGETERKERQVVNFETWNQIVRILGVGQNETSSAICPCKFRRSFFCGNTPCPAVWIWVDDFA